MNQKYIKILVKWCLKISMLIIILSIAINSLPDPGKTQYPYYKGDVVIDYKNNLGIIRYCFKNWCEVLSMYGVVIWHYDDIMTPPTNEEYEYGLPK